ncbi:NAD-dependent malic enzyme [Ornithinimicrobium tianjinense]|uniref:Putative malate oxidoreductase [NAD] n=1 Tax=Ornithinimicrobium tianjinense TaxID=1195761 RepID=A0A917BWP9_9MICO|nr:NAD-dependent malic enzyme [Ornithinimicrobium tianjinense]GGF58610.1 NAD-dependent malic enzyme [Ornithinimicrobium tianjinense]
MPRQFQFRTVDGVETVQIAVRGRQVLARPMLNFGPGYTLDERAALGLRGLLPPAVNTLTEQVRRVYQQFRGQPDDLSRYVFLNQLQDLNEILYYRLVADHLEEMLPIIYTPTVGEAIQKFSSTFDRPRGIYLSIDDAAGMDEALAAHGQGPEDVDLVVVTDSEGILGIGDQGVGGIRIAVGKLAVYTTAAGIHPLRGIPVVLDVGTDNLDLLNDPGYLGARHARVRGERYDAFVAQFADAVRRHFPHALLHWEDFGADNAHRILAAYRDEQCSFNDDIQGTAAVVAAAALAAVRAKGERLADQRIVVHGAGTAGVGVADLMRDIMVQEGLSEKEAESRFWGLGSRGLLHTGAPMRAFQERYARPVEEVSGWDGAGRYDLAEVVRQVRPTVLVGTSAQPGSFTEAIVRDMAAGCDRPVIMPLSNPTSRSEAVPADLLRWTDGRALIATGSPFAPVEQGGTTFEIAQANNALVFPGIGLGAVAVRATRVTDRMIAAAAQAVAERTSAGRLGAPVLPSMRQLRAVSAAVAIRVAEAAVEEGVATRELEHPLQDIHELMWQPVYPTVEVVDHIDEPSARTTEPGREA